MHLLPLGLHGPAVKNSDVYDNPAVDVLCVLPVEKRRLTRHTSDVAVETPKEAAPAKRRHTSGFSQVEEIRETVRVDVVSAVKRNSGHSDPARAWKGLSARVPDYRMVVYGTPVQRLTAQKNNVQTSC